ncbi:hypothetical protein SLA2020_145050 [Shorea laevis]
MAKLTIAAVILVLAATMSLTEAQNTSTSCASELQTTCASYLNSSYLNSSTIPSIDCCNAIRFAAYNELTCLCNLYNNPDVLKPFNISLPAAVQLARSCNYVCTFLVNCTRLQFMVDSSTSDFNLTPLDSVQYLHEFIMWGSSALSPSECVYPPPAAGQAGSDAAVDRIVWTGVTSLLLILAFAVLY